MRWQKPGRPNFYFSYWGMLEFRDYLLIFIDNTEKDKEKGMTWFYDDGHLLGPYAFASNSRAGYVW